MTLSITLHYILDIKYNYVDPTFENLSFVAMMLSICQKSCTDVANIPNSFAMSWKKGR